MYIPSEYLFIPIPRLYLGYSDRYSYIKNQSIYVYLHKYILYGQRTQNEDFSSNL